MNASVQEIIEAFENLAPKDRQVLVAEILRRAEPDDELTPEDFAAMAEQVFLALEAVEDGATHREARRGLGDRSGHESES